MNQDYRAEFEAWYVKENGPSAYLGRGEFGDYMSHATRVSWTKWQTALQSSEGQALHDALEKAAIWHESNEKALSKQPCANFGIKEFLRAEHQEQANLLRAALAAKAKQK